MTNMANIEILQAVLLIGLLAALVWSCIEDVRRRTIPHAATATVAGLYIIYATLGYADPVSGLISGVIFLVIGFVLFQFNLLGGGDAKLIAAVALWAGLDQAFPLAFYVTLAGGLVALGVVLVHRIRVRPDGTADSSELTVPYGIAIAAGGSIVALGGA